jgi:hypothetical protein
MVTFEDRGELRFQFAGFADTEIMTKSWSMVDARSMLLGPD